MSCFGLCKAGFGSLKEIKELDTKEFLDILEYESILSDIQRIMIEEAKS